MSYLGFKATFGAIIHYLPAVVLAGKLTFLGKQQLVHETLQIQTKNPYSSFATHMLCKQNPFFVDCAALLWFVFRRM